MTSFWRSLDQARKKLVNARKKLVCAGDTTSLTAIKPNDIVTVLCVGDSWAQKKVNISVHPSSIKSNY
jgi:hypothetical protein